MRMWMVNPKLMCYPHVNGEHNELHKIVGAINKGKRLDKYFKNGLIEIESIYERHRVLVIDRLSRGYGHYSPLPPIQPRDDLKSIVIDRERSHQELMRRCSNCRSLGVNGVK